MRLNRCIKGVSVGLATASFVFAGAAFGQSAGTAQPVRSWDLVGVNARLDHALDSKSAKQGETVTARLDEGVKTADGVKLGRGTQLTGTVTKVEPAKGGPSSLTLVFTTAQTKDGKQIPVKVTLLSAYPDSANKASAYGVNDVSEAPRHVSSTETIDQDSRMLNHIELHAKVQGDASGTFVKKDGDLKLTAGTLLQVGIGPANGNATNHGE
jgi:hypothetical protein